MLTISSVTVPSPTLLIVNGYLRFSKLAVIVRLEFAVTVSGLSVESDPVHPVKRYSASGEAVIVSEVPEAKEPPVLSTEPPSEAEASTLKKTVGTSVVSSSNASFAHVIRIRKVAKKRIYFLIELVFSQLNVQIIRNTYNSVYYRKELFSVVTKTLILDVPFIAWVW